MSTNTEGTTEVSTSPFSVAMEHVLTILFEQPSDSSMCKAFIANELYNPPDLVSLTYDDINHLCFTNDKNHQQALPIGPTN